MSKIPKNIVSLLFVIASISAKATEMNIPSTHGFGVTQPVAFVPVMVCPPDVGAQNHGGSWRCPENVAPISPEQYVKLLCPGASLSTMSLTGGGRDLELQMGFEMPVTGCGSN